MAIDSETASGGDAAATAAEIQVAMPSEDDDEEDASPAHWNR